jgi:thiamine-monophosphate kinase
MSDNRTDINSLGEFGLIQHLTKNNDTKQPSTLLGIGDDAAVIDHLGKQTVLSSDMLIEGIHFDLTYTPLKHLGYKAVVVNLSDICAMNATPTHILLNIAVSNRFSVEALEEFYDGVYIACEAYNVDLIGGDTTSSPKGFCISVTAVGEVKEDKFVTRKGAQPNDLICVTGDLGAAYLGLTLLEREKKIYMEHPGVQPDLDNRAYCIGKILRPEARLDIIEWLEEKNIVPTAMMDISDGLSSELFHICTQSQVGCEIFEDKLPFHDETKEVAYQFQIDPTACALSGGEDYELLFTVPQDTFEDIKFSEQISVVGYITETPEKLNFHTRKGNVHPLQAQGWQAFTQK